MKRHNRANHPLYYVWKMMRQRCNTKTCKDYKYYGSRGISVCDEWDNYPTFLDWSISNGWKMGLQLDRIDNDGDYSPKNCRYATPQENCRNRSTTKLTEEETQEIKTLNGYTLRTIAKMYGVSKSRIHQIKHDTR